MNFPHFTWIAVNLVLCHCFRWKGFREYSEYSQKQIRGGSRNLRKGAGPSRSFISPFFSFFSLSLPIPLEVGPPLNKVEGMGESCKLPQWGTGGALAENEFGAL